MCGIISVISKKQYGFIRKDLDVFEELLFADTLRGEDSTGIIGVDKYGNIYVDKSADPAPVFLPEYIGSKAHKELISIGVAAIGHNRKGTVGKITDENAHPFVVNDRFALVHNGTLYSHKHLKDTTVDSEALAHHLEACITDDDYSIDTLGTAFETVHGAWACVWYDQKNHRVQFLRNDQRPLWIAEGKDAWYLASEGSMLHWILSRNGVDYKGLALIPTNTLHTLTPGMETAIIVEALPEKKSPPVQSTTTKIGTGSPTGNTALTLVTSTPETLGQDQRTFNLSKNQSKRLGKKLVGKAIEFWVDDYVEKHLTFTSADLACKDFLIMGESDDLAAYKHNIKGEINIDALALLSIDVIDNYFFRGTITSVVFDPALHQITINVGNIVKIPPTIPEKTYDEEVAATVH